MFVIHKNWFYFKITLNKKLLLWNPLYEFLCQRVGEFYVKYFLRSGISLGLANKLASSPLLFRSQQVYILALIFQGLGFLFHYFSRRLKNKIMGILLGEFYSLTLLSPDPLYFTRLKMGMENLEYEWENSMKLQIFFENPHKNI